MPIFLRKLRNSLKMAFFLNVPFFVRISEKCVQKKGIGVYNLYIIGVIYVTQPRRIAATTIAERVADHRSPKSGQNGHQKGWGMVGQGLDGYQVGLEKQVSRDTRIVYMTPAIVTNKMQSDRMLEGVKYLIVDEVHERDMDSEMLLLLS